MSLLDKLTHLSETKNEESKREGRLSGIRIAALATDGFEQAELFDPKSILEDAGAQVLVISDHSGSIKAWDKKDWGKKIDVDMTLDMANADEFDALLLPGGVINPDTLRQNPQAIEFIRRFAEAGKSISAICHGPQLLIEVDAAIRGLTPGSSGLGENLLDDESISFLRGRTMTSYPSLKTDLLNAGANWVDQEVVTDNGLTTSRKPADIPAFVAKMMDEIEEGRHENEITGRKNQMHATSPESPLADARLADTRIDDSSSEQAADAETPGRVIRPGTRRGMDIMPETPNSRL